MAILSMMNMYLGTFKKIEGISKDTQSKMLNTHLGHLSYKINGMDDVFDNKKDQEIYLHYFSSHDKAFEELLPYNPLKMFVIHVIGSMQYGKRELVIFARMNTYYINCIPNRVIE